jgi:TolB-like protein
LADIFISYAREDRDFVDSLASNLEASGLSVWWDRNISGGAEFAQTIEKELLESTTAIVVWSENALSSHWVRDEADFAREQSKLLPLSLDGVLPPLGFRQLHSLSFESSNLAAGDSAFHELLNTLGVSPAQQQEPGRKNSDNTVVRTTEPGLLVVPFASRSSEADLGYLAEDITEDVVTMLASFGHIRVSTRKTSEGQQNPDLEKNRYGDIRYQVEGSVRKNGPRLRITVQLLEISSGENIWARKFDQPLEDFKQNPDNVVEKICGSLFSQLVSAEADRAEFAPPEELGAWELCQIAANRIPHAGGSMEKFPAIIESLENAIRVEPDYALAHAILSWGAMAGFINGIYASEEEMNGLLQKFDTHLRKARTLVQDDLLTQTYIGAAENYSGQQLYAIQTLEKVLSRNPASADAWYMICMPYAYLGRFDEARHAIARAEELSPEAGYSASHQWYSAIIEYLADDIEVAWPLLVRSVIQQPTYGYACSLTAICAHLTGDDGVAKNYIWQAKKHNPNLTPQALEGMFISQPDEQKGLRDYEILKELWG